MKPTPPLPNEGLLQPNSQHDWFRDLFAQSTMLRSAVVIGLAALYDIVEGSNHDLPFALNADGCVVDYQPKCAAQDVHHCLCISRVCTITHLLDRPVPAHAQCRLLPACAPCHDGRGRHRALHRHQGRGLFNLVPQDLQGGSNLNWTQAWSPNYTGLHPTSPALTYAHHTNLPHA